MKTKSILRIFAALTMVLGFAMTGLSQVTGNLTSNASVVGAITVASFQSLEFGNLTLAGGAKTVDLVGTSTGGVAGGTVREGILQVDKTPNVSVGLSFTVVPTYLTNITTPAARLPLSTVVALWNTVTTIAAGTTVLTNGTTTTIGAGNSAPTIYVHVGGTVTPDVVPGANETIAGLYTGTITLSAVYN
jgi:hypothetical protein